jgi:predicted RNase H-like HicB family nuclease
MRLSILVSQTERVAMPMVRSKPPLQRQVSLHEKKLVCPACYIPDFPGCIATGKTRRLVEKLIREAIEFHIEGMQASGEKVPEPSIEAGTVSVLVR